MVGRTALVVTGLALRGSVALDAWALRALVHDGQLLAVTGEDVRWFDISDRDLPVETHALDL